MKSAVSLLLCGLLLTLGQASAQSQHNQSHRPADLNGLARASRLGDSAATRALSEEMFRRAGIPADLASQFGFTNRIITAESAYHNGGRSGVTEHAVVVAVNNFVSALNGPEWAKTDEEEVRGIRMRLLPEIPELVAFRGPPDSSGRTPAIADQMSPLEAAFTTLHLLYQKEYNTEYQLTKSERKQYGIDGNTAAALHPVRTQAFYELTIDPRSAARFKERVIACDRLFEDLSLSHSVDDPMQRLEQLMTVKGAR